MAIENYPRVEPYKLYNTLVDQGYKMSGKYSITHRYFIDDNGLASFSPVFGFFSATNDDITLNVTSADPSEPKYDPKFFIKEIEITPDEKADELEGIVFLANI